jgi:MarR family transcriptional regulator for hemolysin
MLSKSNHVAGSAEVKREIAPQLAARREQVEAYLELTRIQQQIERRSRALFAAEGELQDVTPAQANVLLVLMQERRPLTARRLSEQLALSEVTVGRFIAALERHGWVERQRDPKDARARLIHPTARTREAMPRFIAVANALLDQSFAGLVPEQLRRLGGVLARIGANLSDDGPPSS